MAKDYTKTLNLPKTEFSMRANLPTREPETIKYWDKIGLYQRMLDFSEGRPNFILHDGPPFSNGNIHMGTALNKILKDFINKSKLMSGYRTPYIPGWDNHGMPIESAIIRQNKLDRKKMSIPEFRSACWKFAEKYVNLQRDSFIRLGVTGDWENPYLTMSPEFEAREVLVFGEMFKKGYIYKGLKPVYWCPHDETALAEAEIEYQDDKCESIYVKFRLTDDGSKLKDAFGNAPVFFMIWTTTPWTLPGNLAIALHPNEEYAIIKAPGGEFYITALALASRTMKAGGIAEGEYEIVKTMPGCEFEFMRARHPFLDRDSIIVNADYVTMESGTGCVHIAPGFGADDYITCRKYNIDISVPVDDRGYQTEGAGKFAGMYYEDSNKAILDDMRESGALFAAETHTHSYPHCWRCKQPIIFRATPQWFCSVEAFKEEAVEAASRVTWLPSWGADRIVAMIRERSDWCISRQRHWGLPIPVFYCDDCKLPVCTDESITAISELFAKSGSNAWYEVPANEILPEDFICPHCGGTRFTKETDTLDGWFDSGSSHFSVLENKEGLDWPADLYLEGADQYRGWFQSSLLTAVGAKGQGAPYKAVLTHGWTVDGEGKAMHKSLGNVISPDDMIKKYGADLVRLWVASSDYRVDVRVSDAIFAQLSETYRKIRNTARILLANINDFDPNKDLVPVEQLYDIDRWALSELNKLIATVRRAYDEYEFHIVYHSINNFCTVEMSKLYIDITKDRLYVEPAASLARRSAQTTMYLILSSLARLVAPLLTFTAEEIWLAMPHLAADERESVFLNLMPSYNPEWEFGSIVSHYNSLFDLRETVMKALEIARADKKIGKSLDAKIDIYTTDKETYDLLASFSEGDLEDVFITSGVHIHNHAAPEDSSAYTDVTSALSVVVSLADGERCDRCWKHATDTTHDDDGILCSRCASICLK